MKKSILFLAATAFAANVFAQNGAAPATQTSKPAAQTAKVQPVASTANNEKSEKKESAKPTMAHHKKVKKNMQDKKDKGTGMLKTSHTKNVAMASKSTTK